MADRHDGTPTRDGALTRRSYMRLAGAAAAIGVAGASTAAAQGHDYNVHLGEEGLSEGDVIDGYLDDHFAAGNHVLIPAGEYVWEGGGFDVDADADASLFGPAPGEVTLRIEGGFRPAWRVSGNSTLYVANIAFRGVSTSSEQSRIRPIVDGGSKLLCEHLYWPDGNDGSSDSRPFYATDDVDGVLHFRNCLIAGWTNNGFYMNKVQGRTIHENCVVRNNNIGQIRIGAPNSIVRNCLIILDEEPPTDQNSANSRGVRVRSNGEDILVEDCDFIWTYNNGNPFVIHDEAAGGSGVIRRCRFHAVTEVINDKGGGSNWVAEDCDFAGPNTDVEIETSGCRFGEDAAMPTKTIEEVIGTPVDTDPVEVPDDGSSGGSGDEEEDPEEGEEPVADGSVLEVIARQDGPLNYTFEVDGPVAMHETDGHQDGDLVRAGHGDVIDDSGDVTVVAGFTGNPGAGDAYLIDGELLSFAWDDQAYDFELWLDGEQLDPATLQGADDANDGEEDDGADASTVLEVIARQDGPLNYTFEVDGPVSLHETDGHQDGDLVRAGHGDAIDDSGDVTVVTGFTGNPGAGDAYLLGGDLLSFDWDDQDYDFELWLDGEQVDPASVGSGSGSDGDDGGDDDGDDDAGVALPHRLTFDGTASDEVAIYRFSVSGDVERDEEASEANGTLAWDAMADVVGDGRAVGVVAGGIDVYRYSGEVVSSSVDGEVDVIDERNVG